MDEIINYSLLPSIYVTGMKLVPVLFELRMKIE